MKTNHSIINKLISKSRYIDDNVSIKWDLKERKYSYTKYDAKINIDGNKYLYFVLIKDIKKYLSISLYVYLLKIKKNNKQYKLIKEMFIDNKHRDLAKLYGVIKFNNIINRNIGKENYIKLLYDWTKDGLLDWNKETNKSYICYDTKNTDLQIYIKVSVNDYVIFIMKDKENNYVINYIHKSDIGLYKLIDKKYNDQIN